MIPWSAASITLRALEDRVDVPDEWVAFEGFDVTVSSIRLLSRTFEPPRCSIVFAVLAAIVISAVSMALAVWNGHHREPTASNATSLWSFGYRQAAFSLVAWFVVSPQSFHKSALKVVAAVLAIVLEFIGDELFIFSIETGHAVHSFGWNTGIRHAVDVWCRLFSGVDAAKSVALRSMFAMLFVAGTTMVRGASSDGTSSP